MATFTYALIKGGQVVEYRSYPQAMQVGAGAIGELQFMQGPVAPPVVAAPPLTVTVDQLAALLVSKGVIGVQDVTNAAIAPVTPLSTS